MLGTLDEIVERAIYGFGVAICTSGSNEPFSLPVGDGLYSCLAHMVQAIQTGVQFRRVRRSNLDCGDRLKPFCQVTRGNGRSFMDPHFVVMNGSNRYSSERAYGRSGARYHVKHKGTFTLGYLYSGCLARGP